uniref:phosphonate metabolism protein/1,5-bisphosphokinase (PRPP-forming) PhnN n=1 Tax=uncultured Agrobacterium sp. TaxID=157277 RepID=UPI00258E8B7F
MSAEEIDARTEASTRLGTMIVVVGPSGAGKDTLIDYAFERMGKHPRLHHVRRVITRSSDAGGELHEGVDDAEFERRRLSGAFCVSWSAHGLSYGIPASAKDATERGAILIANGSRAALADFQETFLKLLVINVIARPEVLAARLSGRGRESVSEISRRLERSGVDV